MSHHGVRERHDYSAMHGEELDRALERRKIAPAATEEEKRRQLRESDKILHEQSRFNSTRPPMDVVPSALQAQTQAQMGSRSSDEKLSTFLRLAYQLLSCCSRRGLFLLLLPTLATAAISWLLAVLNQYRIQPIPAYLVWKYLEWRRTGVGVVTLMMLCCVLRDSWRRIKMSFSTTWRSCLSFYKAHHDGYNPFATTLNVTIVALRQGVGHSRRSETACDPVPMNESRQGPTGQKEIRSASRSEEREGSRVGTRCFDLDCSSTDYSARTDTDSRRSSIADDKGRLIRIGSVVGRGTAEIEREVKQSRKDREEALLRFAVLYMRSAPALADLFSIQRYWPVVLMRRGCKPGDGSIEGLEIKHCNNNSVSLTLPSNESPRHDGRPQKSVSIYNFRAAVTNRLTTPTQAHPNICLDFLDPALILYSQGEKICVVADGPHGASKTRDLFTAEDSVASRVVDATFDITNEYLYRGYVQAEVTCTACEIHRGRRIDLFEGRHAIPVKHIGATLTTVSPRTETELLALIKQACDTRRRNRLSRTEEQPSDSHLVFSITVESGNYGDAAPLSPRRIVLVDLAARERPHAYLESPTLQGTTRPENLNTQDSGMGSSVDRMLVSFTREGCIPREDDMLCQTLHSSLDDTGHLLYLLCLGEGTSEPVAIKAALDFSRELGDCLQ